MTQSVKTRREHARMQVTIVASTCDSTPVDFREYSSLTVCTPAAWTAAALGVKVAPVSDTTFKLLYQPQTHSLALGVSVPVLCYSIGANQCHVFPDLGGARFLKFWSNDGAGADEDQTADRTLEVMMK